MIKQVPISKNLSVCFSINFNWFNLWTFSCWPSVLSHRDLTCLPSAPRPGGPGGPGGPGSPGLPPVPSGILKPAGPLPTSAGWHRPHSPYDKCRSQKAQFVRQKAKVCEKWNIFLFTFSPFKPGRPRPGIPCSPWQKMESDKVLNGAQKINTHKHVSQQFHSLFLQLDNASQMFII